MNTAVVRCKSGFHMGNFQRNLVLHFSIFVFSKIWLRHVIVLVERVTVVTLTCVTYAVGMGY